eukprot:TRINITY_DN5762_c1_g1_i10.p2 TRINITY_DN5762_c1_g1~~TRINITY_DN5762_c1_g1_i10.p2  ORF type:complete len:143 (-),score=19.85 TRINITY_DN5762_c1_g1_i10:181-567(-)
MKPKKISSRKVRECLRDLIRLAGRMLKLGGRLVFWVPSTPETPAQEELPTHPGFDLICTSEQFLSRYFSRVLVVMEKVRDLDQQQVEEYYKMQGPPVMRIDKQLSNGIYSDISWEEAYENHKYRGKNH